MMDANTKTYLIEPTAPLVIRSGRPFVGQAGADEARFPPPSTLAGALRTAHAETTDKSFGPGLAKISVTGPLPVKLGEKPSLLVPKPSDALYFWNEDKKVRLVRASPRAMGAGEGADLPEGLLLPVQLAEEVKSKPASGPRWWSFDDLLKWRSANSSDPTFDEVTQNGWLPLPDEIRTHVGIQYETHAAEAGKLFQTAGLSFWQRTEEKCTYPGGSIGIVGRIAGDISAGVITLGGERRLSAISEAQDGLWPKMPADLVADIQRAGGLSLTLLTPALFSKGWQPAEIPGLTLKAAAMERWQPHSGWDLAAKKPRAGRKLVPAGAVFWYKISEISDDALSNLWLTHLSDGDQDKLDGFGLVLPQPWLQSN
jgi:CRISPR-associated protein Cmr3